MFASAWSRKGLTISVLVGTAALAAGPPAAAEVRSPGLPDVAAAERELADARRGLERLVGEELLSGEVPPLPAIALVLAADEAAEVKRLVEADPGIWTVEEADWARALAEREAAALAALREPGEQREAAALPTAALDLLPAARLAALVDRAALAAGEESVFLAGLEARLHLARRLYHQDGLVGPLLGRMLVEHALGDAQLAAGRPATSEAALGRLDGLLLGFQAAIPDAAAVVAAEGLRAIAAGEEAARAGGEAGGAPVLLAPYAVELLELARACRRGGCREALELAGNPEARPEDPYRVVAHLMLPNLLDVVRKVELTAHLAEGARQAVALRLAAPERGGYPAALPGELVGPYAPPGWREPDYRLAPAGGAVLSLPLEDDLEPLPADLRAPLERLLRWELPPVDPL